MDQRGFHLIDCAARAAKVTTHNQIRNVVAAFLRACGLCVVVEEPVPGAPVGAKRPDITVAAFHGGKSALLDVTVRNPAATSCLPQAAHQPQHAAKIAEAAKHRDYRYAPAAHYAVVPLAIEATGALGPEARSFLAKAFAAAKGHVGAQRHATFKTFWTKALSVAVVSAVGLQVSRLLQSLLPRGQDFGFPVYVPHLGAEALRC